MRRFRVCFSFENREKKSTLLTANPNDLRRKLQNVAEIYSFSYLHIPCLASEVARIQFDQLEDIQERCVPLLLAGKAGIAGDHRLGLASKKEKYFYVPEILKL